MSHPDTAVLKIVTPTPRQRGVRNRAVSRFPAASIRVYVLGVDPLRAAGLEAVFEDNAGIDIVVETPSTQTSVGKATSGWLDPTIHVIIVGTLAGSGTMKLIGSIRSARPDLNILVMSPAAGDEAVLSVLKLGAKGFLHEGANAEHCEEAIRAVANGSIWAPRRLQAELIDRLLSSRDTGVAPANVSFTGREQQIMNLLMDGQSNREIARSLKIEERTVKSNVTRLLRKMGVTNRIALSMLAVTAKSR